VSGGETVSEVASEGFDERDLPEIDGVGASANINVSSQDGIDIDSQVAGDSSLEISANANDDSSNVDETETVATNDEIPVAPETRTPSNSILPPNVATVSVSVSIAGENEVTNVDSNIENNGAVIINTSTGVNINQTSEGFERLRDALPEVIAFVFPNPARDFVTISTPRTTISRVEITSARGNLVRSEILNGLRRARINVSDLQQGLYFINIFSDSGMATKKFFKN
jgi:hypothetical protein